ncbi:hypothetical protein MKY51_09895 [Solibacillus sp. FSL R5-0691]|uniref:hypothetical protein n=1 Tax=Solibacillus sp. FSL R5-0691 TaxID=2921653 RepID=UPI0030D40DD8
MGKYILILSLTLLLFGCQQINEEKADNTDSVESVSIYKMIGFSEIIEESLNVITDSEEINSIEEIIKGAEKVAGIVDVFDPHYQVEIGEKTYYLWVHNKEAATIMDEEDTRTVYKISGNLVERLIEIIHQ